VLSSGDEYPLQNPSYSALDFLQDMSNVNWNSLPQLNLNAALQSALAYFRPGSASNPRPNPNAAQRVVIVLADRSDLDLNTIPRLPCDFASLNVRVSVLGLEISEKWDNPNEPVAQVAYGLASQPVTNNYFPIVPTWDPVEMARAVSLSNTGSGCTVTSNAVVGTLDGNTYRLGGYGDYWLYKTCAPDGSFGQPIQVRLQPCSACTASSSLEPTPPGPQGGRTCVTGVAVRASASDAYEFYWNSNQEVVDVFYNGAPVNRSSELNDGFIFQRQMGGLDAYMISLELGVLTISFDHAGGGLSVLFVPTGLSFSAYDSAFTGTYPPYVASGLCGSWDNCPANDFAPKVGAPLLQSVGASALFYNFSETWRVSKAETLFVSNPAGSKFDYDQWNADLSTPGPISSFTASEQSACSFLPPEVAALCAFDIKNNGMRSSVRFYLDWKRFECLKYCGSGQPYSRIWVRALQANPDACDYVCVYPIADPPYLLTNMTKLHDSNYSLSPADLATKLGLDLRGTDLSSAFFVHHPALTRGGRYTFQRQVQRSDLCSVDGQDALVPSQNVSVVVACMPAGTVTITNFSAVSYGTYGFPMIDFYATLSLPSSSYRSRIFIHWQVVEFNSTVGTGTLSSVNQGSLFFGINSLTMGYFVGFPGTYTMELAVSDGCWVTRSRVTFDVVSRCTDPQVRPLPPLALRYNSSGFGQTQIRFSGSTVERRTRYPSTAPRFDGAGISYPLGDLLRQVVSPQENTTFRLVGRMNSATDAALDPTVQVNKTSSTTYNVFRATNLTVRSDSGLVLNSSNVSSPVINNATTTPRLLPYVQVLRPVVTADAQFFIRNTTQTVVTYFNQTVVFTPASLQSCSVAFTGSNFSITNAVPNNYTTNMSFCEGSYVVETSYAVAQMEVVCNTKRNVSVVAYCPGAAVPQVNCDRLLNFNYNTVAFPIATINANSSYVSDPSGATHPRFFSYSLKSSPAGSNATLTPANSQATLNVSRPGVYVVAVGFADGCREGTVDATVRAACGSAPLGFFAPLPATFVFPNLSVSVNSTGIVSPALGTPSLVVSYSATGPTVPPEFGAVTPVTITGGANPTITFAFPGTYIVVQNVSDSCNPTPGQFQQSVTVDCGAVSAVVTGPATNTSTQAGTFAPQTFEGNVTGNGSSFTYGWRIVAAPVGSARINTTSAQQNFTFTPDVPGDYSIRLVGNNGCAYSQQTVAFRADCVFGQPVPTVTPPGTGTVGQAFNVSAGAGIALDGVQSYQFFVTLQGSATINNATFGGVANVSVRAYTPSEPGQYFFAVVVCNLCGQCVRSAAVVMTVNCPFPFVAVASASPTTTTWDQNRFDRIEVTGTMTNLAGINATSLVPLWEVISAPALSCYSPVDLGNVTTVSFSNVSVDTPLPDGNVSRLTSVVQTTTVVSRRYYVQLQSSSPVNQVALFPACFHPDLPGLYTLRLTLTDGCRFSQADVTVNASCNAAPVAVLRNATESPPMVNALVSLDASLSSDQDNDTLSFYWSFLSAPTPPGFNASGNETQPYTPQFSSTGGRVSSFVPVVAGSYVVQVLVSDGCSNATATLTVTATLPCTQVAQTAVSVSVAYGYISGAASVICLDGGSFFGPQNSSLASDAPSGTDGPFSDVAYPDYSPVFTPMQKLITRLQCDVAYSWRLVAYAEQSGSVAVDPCVNNGFNPLCGGSSVGPVAPPLPPSNTGASGSDDEKPVNERSWFIFLMIFLALCILFVAAFVFYRMRRTKGEGGAAGGAGAAGAPAQSPSAQGLVTGSASTASVNEMAGITPVAPTS
jgi:hypothetical protein